jgi:hypothetical protein
LSFLKHTEEIGNVVIFLLQEQNLLYREDFPGSREAAGFSIFQVAQKQGLKRVLIFFKKFLKKVWHLPGEFLYY